MGHGRSERGWKLPARGQAPDEGDGEDHEEEEETDAGDFGRSCGDPAEADPGGGLGRVAGQRAVIFVAVAQGRRRKELVDTFGIRVARGILSRSGYVHGRRMAEAMKTQFKWDSDDDWRRAGARIYALQGLFMLEPGSFASFGPEGGSWRVSYEAEQHILHLGLADYPVCWTLCGLASG